MKSLTKRLREVKEDLVKMTYEIHNYDEEKDLKAFKMKIKEMDAKIRYANSLIKESEEELKELKSKRNVPK